jgi:hypothetical protein
MLPTASSTAAPDAPAVPPVPTAGTAAAMAAISRVLKPQGELARAVAFDERGRRRWLLDFPAELVADADGCRTHHLYWDPKTFALHVWPGPEPLREGVVRLPLHGDTVGLGLQGEAALREWVDTLAQILTIPHICCRPVAYHEFIHALNALDAQGAWTHRPPAAPAAPPTDFGAL